MITQIYPVRYNSLRAGGLPGQRPFRANTGLNAPLALLETFSNGVNEPPRWKVEDFLTGFT